MRSRALLAGALWLGSDEALRELVGSWSRSDDCDGTDAGELWSY